VACLAVGAVVLSGCSEKQEANETLPSTSATPTTPELPPLGPEDFAMPDEARKKTPDGAVEFVRYWVTLVEYLAEHSLDPKPLLELSQGCETCSMIAESLAEDQTAGHTYREYSFEFTEYGPGLLTGDTAEMGFVYVQGPITVVNSNGQVVEERSSGKSSDLQSGALLEWRDDLTSWVITSLTVG
jgi:hypothetical protein